MEYTIAGIFAPEHASQSDPEIIEACLSGDARAWEALVTRYQRLIYTIPLRYGLSESDAGDIFQAVCVILLQNLARLRNRKRLGAWLVITTRRECWRLSRQRQQGATSLDVALLENKPNDEPKPEETFVHQERQALVRAAVERLENRCAAWSRFCSTPSRVHHTMRLCKPWDSLRAVSALPGRGA